MTAAFPPDAGWWEALFFRLAGPDNAVVRALIAGNPNLPAAAFDILVRDTDWEVLMALLENQATPERVVLAVLRHPDAQDFLTEAWCDDAPDAYPFLGADNLLLVMQSAEQWGLRAALRHQNADERVVREALSRLDDIEDALEELLTRFPYQQHAKLWSHIIWRYPNALLDCPVTPAALLLRVAEKLTQAMSESESDGWTEGGVYEHDMTADLCRHPNANAEMFGLFMDHSVFQKEEANYGARCLRLISKHPNATPSQREDALKRAGPSPDYE